MRFLAINRSPIWIIALVLVGFVWFQSRNAYLHLKNPYVVTGWSLFSLMAFLSKTTWIAFGIWLVIGLCIYFGYARSRSNLAAQPG